MAKINDIAPASSSPTTQPTSSIQAETFYGELINGIPILQVEPAGSFDDALAFATLLIDQHPILYIEYQGVKLGVNR